ncbi:MAG: NAD-dependent deacylase [Thermodesulfobacteriota bacterium]|nr:NAD-dependent deacylase [Thermodesulfobacteriota bacterium]
MPESREIEEVRKLIKVSTSLVALTGAGISAESGVPTFRGEDGLWRNFRAEELATPEAFFQNPRLVWEWYDWRRNLINALTCNPAHEMLANLETVLPHFTLITQNVDGLHSKAGNRNVLEIHGTLWKVKCTGCNVVSENYDVPIKLLPYCADCGGLLRPHVVWFGEMLPEDILEKVWDVLSTCDLILVVGTSGIVQPAASFPLMVKRNGGVVIEVNTEKTSLSTIADHMLLGKAGEILPLIFPH